MKVKKSNLHLAAVATSILIGGNVAHAAPSGNGVPKGQPFQALQDQIDILTIDIDEAVAFLQDQIDTLVEEQADQDDLISALDSAVATLEMRVADNENDIANNVSAIIALRSMHIFQARLINNLTRRSITLEARVSSNDSDIAALVLADQNLQELIAGIRRQIQTISRRISANDGDIAMLEGEAEQLKIDLDNLEFELASKQDRVNGYCSPGYSIGQIYPNGRVRCEYDNVSAGVGTLRTYRSSDSVNIGSSIFFIKTVTNSRYCLSGYRAVGGGYYLSGHLGVGNVFRNYPASNTGWRVTVKADSTGSRTLTTYVVCARVQ